MAYIHDIFKRYLDNSCTEKELSILLRYFELDEYSGNLRDLIEQELLKPEHEWTLPEPFVHMVKQNKAVLMERIQSRQKQNKIKRLIVTTSIAASILLVSTFAFFYFNDRTPQQMKVVQEVKDIDPGTNRATLVLENGESITLSEDKTGITVGKDGRIVYTDGTNIATHTSVQYATLSTPRKGQYNLILPDGTKVWLNAESSIRYPTTFIGDERNVEVKGEAYFEVAHNPEQPFIVEGPSQRVKVLGTVFNLYDYPGEDHTVTTLVNGKVEVYSTEKNLSQILTPDRQAVLTPMGYEVHQVDVEPFIAWKNNEFRFRATPLREAIRQIERWYDLDVDYNHIPNDIKIHALITRDKKLSSVLYALEEITNIKFEREGRRLQLMEK